MADLIVIGARLDGQAGVVLDTLRAAGEPPPIGFLDHTPELVGRCVDGVPILGSSEELESFIDAGVAFHVAIGDNVGRHKILERLQAAGATIRSIVHPSAIVSERATLGEVV